MQLCDFGDFTDGQSSTTTTSPSPKTTTTAVREDSGEFLILIFAGNVNNSEGDIQLL